MNATRRVVVDSRCRSRGTPGDYSIDLLTPISDVSKIALFGSSVPFSAPIIGKGNDTFVLEISLPERQVLEIKLPHGDIKEGAAFVANVAGLLPAEMGVSLDGDGRITFTHSSSPFVLTATGSVVRLLGLFPALVSDVHIENARSTWSGMRSKDDGGTHTATAPYALDLTPERYLVVTCDIGGGCHSSEKPTDGAMAIVSPGVLDVAHPVWSKLTSRELRRLKIRITRPGGEEYDFRGRDHRLDFEVM